MHKVRVKIVKKCAGDMLLGNMHKESGEGDKNLAIITRALCRLPLENVELL
jgi:hypothetical protein